MQTNKCIACNAKKALHFQETAVAHKLCPVAASFFVIY